MPAWMARGEEREHAEGEEGVEVGRGGARDLYEPREEKAEESEQEHDAGESPLFGEGGEDEVGLILRQEPELRLRAVADSLPEELAAPHCDLGLIGTVAGAGDIACRVDEGNDAGALIGLEASEPQRARRDKREEPERRKVFF